MLLPPSTLFSATVAVKTTAAHYTTTSACNKHLNLIVTEHVTTTVISLKRRISSVMSLAAG
ncbi:hypothetical protein A2U01_0103650, partial [Trifolium medium]|nr:hypothetical protein [Trifolium medium]